MLYVSSIDGYRHGITDSETGETKDYWRREVIELVEKQGLVIDGVNVNCHPVQIEVSKYSNTGTMDVKSKILRHFSVDCVEDGELKKLVVYDSPSAVIVRFSDFCDSLGDRCIIRQGHTPVTFIFDDKIKSVHRDAFKAIQNIFNTREYNVKYDVRELSSSRLLFDIYKYINNSTTITWKAGVVVIDDEERCRSMIDVIHFLSDGYSSGYPCYVAQDYILSTYKQEYLSYIPDVEAINYKKLDGILGGNNFALRDFCYSLWRVSALTSDGLDYWKADIRHVGDYAKDMMRVYKIAKTKWNRALCMFTKCRDHDFYVRILDFLRDATAKLLDVCSASEKFLEMYEKTEADAKEMLVQRKEYIETHHYELGEYTFSY